MAQEPHKIVIVGGGFAGVYTALRLERLLAAGGGRVQVTLISRDNYFLITPLLFEAGSGILDPRHVVCPIRSLLTKTRFIEADVNAIDIGDKRVEARHGNTGPTHAIEYDQLVLAVGGITNRAIIPGSEHAWAFKSLADAIFLRNRVIDLFEQADVEPDAARRKQLLTFVIVGAGLVGIELAGELTEFLRNIRAAYRNVQCADIRVLMYEAGPRFLPEMAPDLADYAQRTLESRGMIVAIKTPVKEITPEAVRLADGQIIDTTTVLLCAGVAPNPLLEKLPLQKIKGRIAVGNTMRVAEHPEIWAIGDCAAIPDPEGKPYPQLAQHALREARLLADNLLAAFDARPPKPFDYQSKGTMAALGHFNGIGKVEGVKIRGFLAWWVWRSYYLLQMPQWSRRIRIVIDWTVALFFHNDIVKLDLSSLDRREDESRRS